MVISSGGVDGWVASSAGRILFHGAKAGCHALEGVIGKELELEEQEESIVYSVWGDVGLHCTRKDVTNLLFVMR